MKVGAGNSRSCHAFVWFGLFSEPNGLYYGWNDVVWGLALAQWWGDQ